MKFITLTKTDGEKVRFNFDLVTRYMQSFARYMQSGKVSFVSFSGDEFEYVTETPEEIDKLLGVEAPKPVEPEQEVYLFDGREYVSTGEFRYPKKGNVYKNIYGIRVATYDIDHDVFEILRLKRRRNDQLF